MQLSENLKRVLGAVFFVALGVGYYWWEHRPEPEEKDIPVQPQVIVTKATNACFSDLVRATGHFVPRREAVVGADQEGSKSITSSSRKAIWSPRARSWRG